MVKPSVSIQGMEKGPISSHEQSSDAKTRWKLVRRPLQLRSGVSADLLCNSPSIPKRLFISLLHPLAVVSYEPAINENVVARVQETRQCGFRRRSRLDYTSRNIFHVVFFVVVTKDSRFDLFELWEVCVPEPQYLDPLNL